jgi:hypothetical protein
LADVAHSVGLFVERELVPLLRAADRWAGLTPEPGPVHVCVQAIEVELAVPELGRPNLRLAFDHDGGTITARVAEPGWLPRLDPKQAAVLAVALEGFCAMTCAGFPTTLASSAPVDLTYDEWAAFWQAEASSRWPCRSG